MTPSEKSRLLDTTPFIALYEQVKDAVLILSKDDNKILSANNSAINLLGFSEEELLNQSILDLTTDGKTQMLGDFLEGLEAGSKPSALTVRLKSRYFSSIPCDLSVQQLTVEGTGILLVVFEDLSEHIRAMEEIELRNIAIANVQSGVTIADARQPDLPLIYVNKGFQDITGYTAREVIGRSCRFLQGEDRDQPELTELRQCLKGGTDCVVQLRNFRKDGTLFFNELHISPVRNEAGELTHFVGIQLDVTENVRARQSLERSEKRTRLALEKEKELNEIKSRFISMVSHEFRTPMTGIQTSAALLKRLGGSLEDEKQVRHLGNIMHSLKRMNRLLDDVLFFSRADANKQQVELSDLDLDDYFSRFQENISLIHPGRTITFVNDFDKSDTYRLDEHLLDHIFQNLIGNALKYSPDDAPVTCKASYADGTLEFSVQDRGIGIPETDQNLLFEAFHRAGNVGARQGTGLGLNIALRAIELLNGTIEFKSTEDKGSTFLVRIPASSKQKS